LIAVQSEFTGDSGFRNRLGAQKARTAAQLAKKLASTTPSNSIHARFIRGSTHSPQILK